MSIRGTNGESMSKASHTSPHRCCTSFVNLRTAPSAPVVSPIDGTIRQRGKAYEKDERFDTIWIDGTGEYQGMLVKMFYVDRDGPVQGNDNGAEVKAGTTIVGAAQDRSQKSEKGSGMKPHVHVEVEWHGRRIDPATVLPIWESRSPN